MNDCQRNPGRLPSPPIRWRSGAGLVRERVQWVGWARAAGLGLLLALAGPPLLQGGIASAAETQEGRPSRVGFWRLPGQLRRALARSLRSWDTSLVRVPAPAEASRQTKKAAAQVCQELELEALVWATRSGRRHRLHLYDARNDTISARAIAARPSAATAAALALSLKSILRGTPDAAVAQQPDSAPDTAPDAPPVEGDSVAERARRHLERKAREDSARPAEPDPPRRRRRSAQDESEDGDPEEAKPTESEEEVFQTPRALRSQEVALDTEPDKPRPPPAPIFASWRVLGQVSVHQDEFEALSTELGVGGGRAWRQGNNRRWLQLEVRFALPRNVLAERFSGTVNSSAIVVGGGYARALGWHLSLGLGGRAGMRATRISGQASGLNAPTRSTNTAFTLEVGPRLALEGERYVVFVEPSIELSVPRRRYVVNDEPITELNDFAPGAAVGFQWKL